MYLIFHKGRRSDEPDVHVRQFMALDICGINPDKTFMLHEQNPHRIPPWGSATIIQWAADISMVHTHKKKPFSVKRRANMIIKSGKRDSNSRPQPWQGCALPTELFPHFSCYDFSEEEETRTPTSQLTLPPQSSASTNSATSP